MGKSKVKAKKNHYVPKCLLKRFANEENSIYIVSRNSKEIKLVPYESQCQKNYLYGIDNDIEYWLSTIEYKSTNIFNKLDDKLPLTLEESNLLKKFILIQEHRVKGLFEKAVRNIENREKEIYSILYDSKDIYSNGYEQLAQKENEQDIAKEMMDSIREDINSFDDLEVAILRTQNQFINTDNPVNVFNLFFPNEGLGYLNAGLIVLMPISPKTIIILYDSKMYNIKDKTIEINIDETQIINLYSSLTSYGLIYGNDEKVIKKVNDSLINITPYIDIEKCLMYGLLNRIIKIKEKFNEYIGKGYRAFNRNYELNNIPEQFLFLKANQIKFIYDYLELTD